MAAAIPIYIISVILLHWAMNDVARAGSVQFSITLATLVALMCSCALFSRLRRAFRRPV
jgi:hypothetical protein